MWLSALVITQNLDVTFQIHFHLTIPGFFFQFYKIFFALEPSQERKTTLCQGVSNSISVYKQIDKHFRTYNCRDLFSYCSKYNININSNLEMLLWCSWFHINASVQPGMLDNGTSWDNSGLILVQIRHPCIHHWSASSLKNKKLTWI